MNDDLFLRENLEQFRNELAEKKIFITGGTGFFGKWFQKSFLAANVDAELTILSRDPELFRKNFPEFNSEKVAGYCALAGWEHKVVQLPMEEALNVIADALKAQHGIEIEKQKIVQTEPIKSYGSYDVKCKFGYEISGVIHLLIVEA